MHPAIAIMINTYATTKILEKMLWVLVVLAAWIILRDIQKAVRGKDYHKRFLRIWAPQEHIDSSGWEW